MTQAAIVSEISIVYTFSYRNLPCLHSFTHLLKFRSQAAILSEKTLFSLFPIEKPKLPNLTLP